MKKAIKYILISIVLIIILLILGIYSIPSYVEKFIERHDMELVGRQITIDEISINYLHGVLYIRNMSLKEKDGLTDFVHFDLFQVDIDYLPLFSKEIYLRLSQLKGLDIHIIQNQKSFNFDDLFGADDEEKTSKADSIASNESEATVDTNVLADSTMQVDTSGSDWKLTMKSIEITESRISYDSDLLPEPIQFDHIELLIPLLSDTSDLFELFLGADVMSGGSFDWYVGINGAALSYRSQLKIDSLNVGVLKPYVDPFLNIGKFAGLFQTDLFIEGDSKGRESLNFGGNLELLSVEMKDRRDDLVAAVKQFELKIDTVRMNEGVYVVDTIRANELFLKYEIYPDGSNWENLIVSTGDSLSSESSTDTGEEVDYSNPFQLLVYYLKDIAESYTTSSYQVDLISFENSSVDINDFGLDVPFRYKLTDLNVRSESLISTNESIKIDVNSRLNRGGNFKGKLVLQTKNLNNVDLEFLISSSELSHFSPYSIEYVDLPIVEGELIYDCQVEIREGILKSENKLNCQQIQMGHAYDHNPIYHLPVKLAVGILRDLDGNVELDIPIEGDLRDPEYKFGRVIWAALENILLKAATSPARLLASSFQVEEEDISMIRFEHLESQPNKGHHKQLKSLAKILEAKPELDVDFVQMTRDFEEAERYAVAEAKYQYLHKIASSDAIKIDEELFEDLDDFDLKDENFVAFVDKRMKEEDLKLPIQSKCLLLVGEGRALDRIKQFREQRERVITTFFSEKTEVSEGRVGFQIAPSDSLILDRASVIYNIQFDVK